MAGKRSAYLQIRRSTEPSIKRTVLRNSTSVTSTAREKSNVHYPQVIYDEKGMDNPYRFASKWYPEIIVTDEQGNERTVQKTIDDYKKTIDK